MKLRQLLSAVLPKKEEPKVETQTSILKKKSEHFKVKCSIDEDVVPCSELELSLIHI